MAVRHTITRQQVARLVTQADPDFDTSGDFSFRIKVEGDGAHLFIGRDCPECVRYEAKLAGEVARKRAEGREDEI